MRETTDRAGGQRPRSRRSLLLGAAGGLVGWLGLRGAKPAAAADGDPVKLGRRNVAGTTTRIANTSEGETALRAAAIGPGAIALDSVSLRGTGVHGYSRDGNGVSGESVFGTAVSGLSTEAGSTAVSGDSSNGVGVQGGSRSSVGVQGNSQFGVAVRGGNISETHPAVSGWAQNGQTGVMGRSTAFDEFDEISSPKHVGVYGVADRPGNTGVLARSLEGRALVAKGRVRFTTSGIAIVPDGESEVSVTTAFEVVGSAKVLAIPNGDPGNAATVHFVEVDPAANALTIHMTEAVSVATPVAWFLID